MCNRIFWLLLAIFSWEIQAHERELDPILKKSITADPILETRQIQIPGYPKAYNPSLIEYGPGYLLSFRFTSKIPQEIENCPRRDYSFIGLVKLDENFDVSKKSIQLLNLATYSPQFSLTAEDARLLNVGNRIFIFFNDLPLTQKSGRFAMYFGEIVEERGEFVLKEKPKPLKYVGALSIEKNWSPFFSGEKLYVIYSDEPRIILEVDPNTGDCQEVSRSDHNYQWQFGRIRGGTPGNRIEGGLLTFFHSSFYIPAPVKENKPGRNYAYGAYLFDESYPFYIRKITPQPLGFLEDYTRDNGRKVIFPGGLVIEDEVIWVVWGKNDNQIFLTAFDKKKLIESMVSLN